MRRLGQWLSDFSYEDGPQGSATSSHSFGRHELSRCALPASADFVRATRAENISRLRANAEQSASPANAGVAASKRGRRRQRFDDYRREQQLAAEITHCVARPQVRENYVEVRLSASAPEPRDSSIRAPECASSAHSCDLRIGVAMQSSP